MTTEATKVCPQCSEAIPAQAMVCRFCGFDYRGTGRPTPAKTNGLAVASMVLGILWICWIGSILALIFGYVGKKQIDESGGTQSGRGMAVAGIVLGWIGVATVLIWLVFGLMAGGLGSLTVPLTTGVSP